MRARLLSVAILSLVALAIAQSGNLVSVRMKDGRKVVGHMVEKDCSNDHLVLRDMRSKRKVTIPWSQLDDDVAHKLRVELGFEVAAAEKGTLMEADQIRNKAGSLFTGLVLNRDTARKDGHYLLKTAEATLTIGLADIREERKVEVEATVVYTPTELYERRVKEKPPETAEDHFRTAEYARLVGALPQAKSHYETLLSMNDTKYPEAAINRLIQRVDKLIASTEAVEALKSIERHIVYKRFDKAKEELDAFAAQYGEDEDFAKEIEEVTLKMETTRKEYFADRVAKQLLDAVKDALDDKVRADTLTIRDAQNYASGEVGAEESATRTAVEAVAAKLGIPAEEVVELWKARPKRSIHKAFYRDGTFIVVDDLEDALANAPKPKAPKGKDAPKTPNPRPRMTPDKWWEAKREARKWTHLRDFLYAYWAEKAGVVELLAEKFDGCPTCVGKGYVIQTLMTQQGNLIFPDRCTTCYMAKGFRIVQFK